MRYKSANRGGVIIYLAIAAGLVGVLAVGSAGDVSKKMPIPAKAEQDQAAALIRELYAEQFQAAARDEAEKGRLAALLLQEGKDTRDFPAGRFVLLQQARDLAVEVGEISTALQAVEELGLSFQFKTDQVFAMKVQTLDSASQGAGTHESHREVIESALFLLEEVLAEDDYDTAGKLIKTAETSAKKMRSVNILASVKKRGEEVAQLQQGYAKVKDHAEKLKTMPGDPKANLEVGKYQAFTKGNWKKGLPLLAKGGDAALKNLAQLELGSPKDAGKQLALGEGWHKTGQKLEGMARIHVLLRSYHWLQQSAYRLTGKDQKLAQDLMDKIIAAIPPEYRMGEITQELRQFQGHTGPVFGAAISPDGRKVATASQDNTVRIWDVKTGQFLRTLTGHAGPVWTVAFSPDGRWVASGSYDNSIRLWDLVSGGELRRFDGHTDYVRSVAFSPDGTHLLSGGDDRTVRLWKVATGQQVQEFKGHDHFVMSVAISADGKRGVSGSLDKTIRLWDLEAGKELKLLRGHQDTVLSVAISADGGRILSASTDRSARLWDAESGKMIHLLRGHQGFVTGVAITPDGRRALTAGYDNTIRLWDLKEGEEIRRLPGHTDIVWTVAFSADGRLAVSSSHDRTAKLWGGEK